MKQLLFQTWPDSNRDWHWVVFNDDSDQAVQSPRAFQSREEAEWDAKRFIQVLH